MEDPFIRKLRAEAKRMGSKKSLAEKIGISRQALHGLLAGNWPRRETTAKLKKLGLAP